MESILTNGVDNNFFFYFNAYVYRQLDLKTCMCIDNWRQTKK